MVRVTDVWLEWRLRGDRRSGHGIEQLQFSRSWALTLEELPRPLELLAGDPEGPWRQERIPSFQATEQLVPGGLQQAQHHPSPDRLRLRPVMITFLSCPLAPIQDDVAAQGQHAQGCCPLQLFHPVPDTVQLILREFRV